MKLVFICYLLVFSCAYKIRILIIRTISDITSEIKEKLLDYVERYALTLLYRILFCPPFTNDEEKDLAIQKRLLLFTIQNNVKKKMKV